MPFRVRNTLASWLRIRPRHAIKWLLSLSAAITLGLLGSGAALLLDARHDAWRQARQASDNLTVTLARDIASNIEMFDLALLSAMEASRLPGIDQASPEIRQMAMFGMTAGTAYLGALLIVGPDGNIVANSTGYRLPPRNFADREWFLAHRDRPDLGLFISRPFASRLRNGDPAIAISRRLSGPDGSFAGVVSDALRLAYFKDLFDKLNLGNAGSITLFRDDGRVLMRRPFRPGDIDADLGQSHTFLQMTGGAGTFADRAALDGVLRLYTYRRVGDLPLVLTVAIAVDDVYAAWTRKALGIGAVLSILCCSTMGLCLLFRAELMRRTGAETALRAAAERLRVMATTDALTGLSNRRAFEDALSHEWLRSVRSEHPIALLLLDADCFKLFNDRYGHPAGDTVLRQVARCIKAGVLRPADTCARYGGEEFVVLLPETDLPGAAVVAERIRASFADLNIPHEDSPHRRATVSVGVAMAWPGPGPGGSPAALVQQADLALYQAKATGRNRVVLACGSSAGDADGSVPQGSVTVFEPCPAVPAHV